MAAFTSRTIRRPGLSFELAPPQRSHPNRTDIACFIGCVSRRSKVRSLRLMPEVLARWVESQPAFRAITSADPASLRHVNVALDTVADFKASLQAALNTTAWPEVVDEAALSRLLHACRDYSPVPAAVVESLRLAGYVPGNLLGRSTSGTALEESRAQLEGWTRIQRLMNLPIRFESFESFAQLFAWERREVLTQANEAEAPFLTTPLGSALRAYFASGGRTCYVVVTGEPVALFASPQERYAALALEEREQVPAAGETSRPGSFDLARRVPILPNVATHFPGTLANTTVPTITPVATDPSGWRGIEQVFGLGDVSFLVVPDLVDAIASPVPQMVAPEETLATLERFEECVEQTGTSSLCVGRRLPPPACSEQELAIWKTLLTFTRGLLDNAGRSFNRRDVQLLASLPLSSAEQGAPKQGDWAAWLTTDERLHSDRIQLAWPWLRTRESGDCQGGVEAPEGTLAGVLAASALAQGSYRSAARWPIDRLLGMEPLLDLGQASSQATLTQVGELTLADRVCLIATTSHGPQLMSDVTLAADPARRAGAVRRLINVVIAQARAIGEELVFEPNGEALWDLIVERLSDFGRTLLALGALSTDAGSHAFTVRCGRLTMAQADVDAGRVLVEIAFVPAQPIARIVVALDLRDAAHVSVRIGDHSAQAA